MFIHELEIIKSSFIKTGLRIVRRYLLEMLQTFHELHVEKITCNICPYYVHHLLILGRCV